MPQSAKKANDAGILLNIIKPYDFALSLQAIRSFTPALSEQTEKYQFAVRIDGKPTLIELSPIPGETFSVRASSIPAAENSSLRKISEWVLFAELDLSPLYQIINNHPNLTSLVESLYGIKPLRPLSIFEMAVIAITEQQISLAAAYSIRSRMIEGLGESVGNQWIFPEPQALASASLDDLRSFGLSRQKADYIHDLARKIIDGTLDLDKLKTMDDEKARETIMNIRGFGRWSADYILIRGLARPDCVPIDDLAIRSVVGEFLGDGPRVSPIEATKKLEPFKPYRGLLAFYLLVKHRLNPQPMER